MAAGYIVFDLTPSTRGAAQERRVIIQGVELRNRVALIGGIGFGVGFILTLALWQLIGQWALALPVITTFGALWGVEGRSRRGLKLRNWQDLTRRVRNDTGTFLLCGRPFDPLANTFTTIHVAAAPGPTRSDSQLPDLVAGPLAGPGTDDADVPDWQVGSTVHAPDDRTTSW